MRKFNFKTVKEVEGTLFFFLNSVTQKESIEELERELSEKTNKNVVVLDPRFEKTIINL